MTPHYRSSLPSIDELCHNVLWAFNTMDVKGCFEPTKVKVHDEEIEREKRFEYLKGDHTDADNGMGKIDRQ